MIYCADIPVDDASFSIYVIPSCIFTSCSCIGLFLRHFAFRILLWWIPALMNLVSVIPADVVLWLIHFSHATLLHFMLHFSPAFFNHWTYCDSYGGTLEKIFAFIIFNRLIAIRNSRTRASQVGLKLWLY